MKFTISVTRTSYGTINFDVEADNLDAAKDIAMELAEDAVFSEHSCEYEANELSRVDPTQEGRNE